jgi:hypothetical protein
MDSDEALAFPIEMDHPWAQSPQSIGSIATMYMSILFVREFQIGELGYDGQEDIISKHISVVKSEGVLNKILKNLVHKVEIRIYLGSG